MFDINDIAKQHLNQCCLRRYKEPKKMDILPFPEN